MNRLAQTSLLVQRLAMLVAGGVNPAHVWVLLHDDRHVGNVAKRISERQEMGASIADALSAEQLNLLAALWQIAEVTGAPMAESLMRLSAQLEALRDSERKRQVAFAGPRSTMKLVLFLPIIGCGFSLLLGFNTLEVLVATPIGWVIGALGLGLLASGQLWSTRMLNRAAQQTALPGFLSELLAVALVGGSSVRQAKLNVTNILDQHPIAGISLRDVQAEGSAPNQAIALAERAGVSVGEVLRAQAHAERRDASANQDEAAARLGVKLMLPLGVCVLPAFVLLTVVPMTLSIFRQTSFS